LSFLSLFIGIKDIYLAYVFDLSVASMAFVIYLIIKDLAGTPKIRHIVRLVIS